jgi:hypothetical protein
MHKAWFIHAPSPRFFHQILVRIDPASPVCVQGYNGPRLIVLDSLARRLRTFGMRSRAGEQTPT